VLAWKMSDQLRKEDIIANYLNVVPFGRMTYGAEAAAQAFFKKSIKADAPDAQKITLSEAMALVAMVKQPEADYEDPETYPGYDPTRGEEGSVMRQNAERNSHERWDYVRGQLTKLSTSDHERFPLTQEELAAAQFPTTWIPEAQYSSDQLKQPVGLIVNHVLDELTHSGNPYFANMSWESIRNGGFQITTTIDPRAQAAAVNAADETVAGSVMNGQPDNMQAALVAVEPGKGRVLAYYGGHDGTDVDFAGIYQDEDGEWAGFGGHPPGSSMKAYVVGAAMRAGYSLNSYWQWTEHDQAARTEANGNRIRNASQCTADWDAGAKVARSGLCSMLDATVASLNIPFYEITMSLGASTVLQTAMDAGVEHIWGGDHPRSDLLTLPGGANEAVSNGGVGLEVGIGQYPITVLDHANGMATFAAGGLRAKAHFVIEVKKNADLLYGETLPNPDGGKIFNQAQSDLVNYALHQVAPGINIDGFEAATKTGTWEYNQQADQNAHAWNVGYTSALAAAVWVGPKHDEMALHDANGGMLWGSTLPRSIWTKFMTEATEAMGLQGQQKFNAPNFNVGMEIPPMAHASPTPSAVPTTTTTQPRPTTTTPRTTTPPATTTTTTTPPTTGSTGPGNGGGGGGGG
jgi:membrane peptidoglycan carboxypeptidase